MKLKDKIAVITGGSSGIGREMAIELAQMRLNLVVSARDNDQLDSLARLLTERFEVNVIVACSMGCFSIWSTAMTMRSSGVHSVTVSRFLIDPFEPTLTWRWAPTPSVTSPMA